MSDGAPTAGAQPTWFQRHRIVSGCMFAGLVFGAIALEAVLRIAAPQIQPMGSDRALLRADAFGDSYGLRPGATGLAHGARIYVDERGFRGDPGAPPLPPGVERIVLLGDSVFFGIGVEAPETFPEILERELGVEIINTAVLGYGMRDYVNVAEHWLVPEAARSPIRLVVLGLCLNDVDSWTQGDIKRELAGGEGPPPSMFRALQQRLWHGGGVLSEANAWLRVNSRLFLLLKALALDLPRLKYQDIVARHTDQSVAALADRVQAIRATLRARGVPLLVTQLPFSYQVRADYDHSGAPQRRISAELRSRGVPVCDFSGPLRAAAIEAGHDPTEMFKFNDMAHLSPLGHRLLADVMLRDAVLEGGVLPDYCSPGR